jgi:hypothetical protein
VKLPLAIVERDGHIWIRCTHPACMTQRGDKGYMYPLDNMMPEANGHAIQNVIEHVKKIHGTGRGELWPTSPRQSSLPSCRHLSCST